jgi:hypothetical protein
MHDIGRNQQEYGETQEFQEAYESSGLGETYGETFGETYEGSQEAGGFETFESQESPINEALEMELASELLEVTSEQEMDRFLGDLFKKAVPFAGQLLRSPLGRSLLNRLKPLVKKVLPIAGAAASIFGGPIGGLVSSQLTDVASKAFGLELEGMSQEDAQFEVARRAVRLATAAANAAASAPPAGDPRSTAQMAIATAAQRHAPGLLRGGVLPGTAAGADFPSESPHHGARRGVWIRRGRRILLLGV